MSNENNSIDKSFEIACKSIEVLGDAGVANAVSGAVGAVGGMASSVVDSAGRTASSVVEMFDHALQSHQTIKLQKLQNKMQQMNLERELAHKEKMQKIQMSMKKRFYKNRIAMKKLCTSSNVKLSELRLRPHLRPMKRKLIFTRLN